MDCIPQLQAEDCSKAGHGLSPVERLGVRVLGRNQEMAVQGFEPWIVRGHVREVDLARLQHGGSVQALGDPARLAL